MKFVSSVLLICFCSAMICSVEGCPKKIKTFFAGPDKVEIKVEYKGCFPGKAHHTAMEYPNIRIALCNDHCYPTGSKYMGLIGNKCFCESFLENSEKKDDNECSVPCPGDEKEKCGDEKAERWSAYTTGPKYP
ncbi:hypothetical protein BOX15_Mlig029139g1 [Macrostomum lignano]|uniref:WSC domain-containing protein n=1 Tax=Macrostomum lignano TaxID=282301 RepID=A0A267F7Z6_9PLAT|nr:hypothetical protein BOX15_Mlig023815g1 [Macrostomum lignano]PAA77388.1 hypothetical protein BOX15_Mlig023815g3 [Macrostomum lignano]PAA77389.1 hypothetical protein BOX15_Mlig029139g1 [Macrostomum lignano]